MLRNFRLLNIIRFLDKQQTNHNDDSLIFFSQSVKYLIRSLGVDIMWLTFKSIGQFMSMLYPTKFNLRLDKDTTTYCNFE